MDVEVPKDVEAQLSRLEVRKRFLRYVCTILYKMNDVYMSTAGVIG